ncbi:MAG: GNAT family N-acetyltransferase [Thermodesulfobacteriota bacterium]
MEIKKFDRKIDDISIVAELIIRAYSDSGQNISYDKKSIKTVQDFVETGNNFIGYENIHLCLTDKNIAGLVIGYTGKSYSKIKTLLDLLLKLKLTQFCNYLIISSQLFDTAYTPYLEEDDFYISVIFVDGKYRNRGIGTLLLNHAVEIAKEKGCKKIVLEVDRDNEGAQSLYKKFGFISLEEEPQKKISPDKENLHTMQYNLKGLANG